MPEYQGHRSWNAWNIALWIGNDQSMYIWACDLVKEYGRRKAARIMTNNLQGHTTPDGGKYNFTCIYEALADL